MCEMLYLYSFDFFSLLRYYTYYRHQLSITAGPIYISESAQFSSGSQVGSSDLQSSGHATQVSLHRRNHRTCLHCSRSLLSSDIPLPVQPFTRTDFSRRAFRSSAPPVWNSLPQTVSDQRLSDSFFLNPDL